MSLEIQFVDRSSKPPRLVEAYQIRGDGFIWSIPEVILAPVDRLPMLRSVRIAAEGEPLVVADRIRKKFSDGEFDPPRQLGQREALGNSRVDDAGPLPPNSVIDLTVTVVYQDSDGHGTAIGPEKTSIRSCRLYSTELPSRPAEVDVPPHFTVTADEPARLEFRVKYPASGVPSLALTYPDTLLAPGDPLAPRIAPALADLRDAAARAVRTTPVRVARSATGDAYAVSFAVRPAQATKTLLSDLESGLLIPITVELPEGTSGRTLMSLEVSQSQFEGWLAIDFGTTNSTVTVHGLRAKPPVVGMPPEQDVVLRKLMGEWFAEPAATALPKGRDFESQWKMLLTGVARYLNLDDPARLAAEFAGLPDDRFFNGLARLEIALQSLRDAYSPEFRRGVNKRLNDIFRRAFREPTLGRLDIYPLKIDLTRNASTVESEIEVLSVEPYKSDDQKVTCRMGKEVHDAKLEALSEGGVDPDTVIRRFLPSPKRYFGTDRKPFEVILEDGQYHVTVAQLMRGGWKNLIHLADRVRDQDPDFGTDRGPFRKVVVTYPTVAPPSVRQVIPRLLKDLGLGDVRTDYDEAVAAAIFYMFREYSGVAELGLESFKARSRLVDAQGRAWSQNVLLLDIGGGTTDVALIGLTLTEEKAFEPGEDPGAGGRYYKITPKLLSSTGNTRLGGERMTQRVFRLLKAAVADRMLELVQDGRLTLEPVKNLLMTGLPAEAKDARDRYKPGWLVKVVDQDDPDKDKATLNPALEVANRVIPTRWAVAGEGRSAALQVFYNLWEQAELAKRELGSRRDETAANKYLLTTEKFTDLINQSYPGESWRATDASKDLRIEIHEEQVNRAIGYVVRDAVRYAMGAVEQLPAGDAVDWLILSGQSCHLNLVQREMREAFQKTRRFVWNPERLTFVPEYAKVSTSIGACIAEVYRRRRQEPSQMKSVLRRGINMLQFEIDNLKQSLPCSFAFALPGSTRPVFQVGTELTELDEPTSGTEPRGKARSRDEDGEWLGAAIQGDLVRIDFTNGPPQPWGSFDGQRLIREELKIREQEWLSSYRLRFEVDHRLSIDVLVAKFAKGEKEPHYRLTGNEGTLNLASLVDQHAKNDAARKAQAAAQPAADQPAAAQPAVPRALAPLPPLFETVNGVPKLQWSVVYLPPTDQGQKPAPVFLIDAENPRPVTFHHQNDSDRATPGWLSTTTLPHQAGVYRAQLFAIPVGGKTIYPLKEIDLPGKEPTFRRHYRFSLDAEGILRAHAGEAPYWDSDDPKLLEQQPGRVYRVALSQRPRPEDEEGNPFSGLN